MKSLFDLETIRINEEFFLDRLGPEHIMGIYDLYSNPDTARYLVPWEYQNIEEAYAYYKKTEERFQNHQAIYYAMMNQNEMLGILVLHSYQERGVYAKASLGYGVRKKYQRQGYGTYFVTKLIEAVFQKTNVRRIEATVNPENLPSQHLLERLGFHREGLLRHFFYNDRSGQVEDRIVYSVIK